MPQQTSGYAQLVLCIILIKMQAHPSRKLSQNCCLCVFLPIIVFLWIKWTQTETTLVHKENMISRLICYSLLFSMWFLLPVRRYASAGYKDRNVSVCHAPVLCQNEES